MESVPRTDRPEDDPRVRLAGERTLLAWVRTGLAMMGFGFVVARFGLFLREMHPRAPHSGTHSSFWIGSGLILLGIVVNVLAAVQHYRFLGRLRRGEPESLSQWSMGIIVAIVLAAIGVGMTGYLLVLDE